MTDGVTVPSARRTIRRAAPVRPDVAVVMAVYNGARFLEHSLRSIAAQSLQPAQVIVVDDGSTDDSCDIIGASELADRITMLTQPNAGQSAARNAGVERCTAEFVAFLDQDDVWHPDHLRDLVRRFDDDSVGWVYSDFAEIDDEGRLVVLGFHRAHLLNNPKMSLAELIGEDMMVLPSATIVRTSAYRDVGGFDPDLSGYEDDDLFIRLFRRHWLPSYVSAVTVQFRVHAASSSMSRSFGRSRLRFLDKLIEQVPDNRTLNRYYVRDLVVPRLLRTTMGEYITCLMHDDLDGAAMAAEIATQVAARSKVSMKRRCGLWVIRRPTLCQRLLVFRSMLPKSVRRRVVGAVAYRTDVRPVRPNFDGLVGAVGVTDL